MTSSLTITIVTPAHASTQSGNRITAERWQAILQRLGHRVTISTGDDAITSDLLVAIHAWRSAEAVTRFRKRYPAKPIIVCLSGTDVYAYQQSHPLATLGSMAAATALVGLHDLVGRSIPERFHGKLYIMYQSAPTVLRQPNRPDVFDVCVIGHLRAEKDPLRTAAAARLLPPESRLRLTHVGRAMDAQWAAAANAEMAENPRYHWLGEVSMDAVRNLLATTRLMVLSSVMEGGANVLGEAIAAGVPVVTSAIDGSLGLLGTDYPGTFTVGDTAALALMLERAENDPAFLALLGAKCAARIPLFAAEREEAAWTRLIADVTRRH